MVQSENKDIDYSSKALEFPEGVEFDGIVQYTDGSARPNPGAAGSGLHGYIYKNEPPKKGIGHKTHILTNDGYKYKIDVKSKDRQVTPIKFFNMIGAIGRYKTNNVAELTSYIEALNIVNKFEPKEAKIFSDSKLVVDGTNQWIPKWKELGWRKVDGGEPLNLDLWKRIDSIQNEISNKRINLNVEWVLGHSDNPGNIEADKFAVIGSHRSRKLPEYAFSYEFNVNDPNDYWKKKPNRNPLLDFNGMIFNTDDGFNAPGIYYLTNVYSEKDIIGAPTTDTCFNITFLNEPDPVLEQIRKIQSEKFAKEKINAIIMARLDNIFNVDNYYDLLEYGSDITHSSKKRKDLFNSHTRAPLTRVLMPPKIAYKAVLAITELTEIYDLSLIGNSRIINNDITFDIYDTVEGKNTTKLVLKDSVKENRTTLGVKVNHNDPDNISESLSTDLILTFGVDILNVPTLNKLVGEEPTINLITWSESDRAIRYATIVKCKLGVSITAGVYNNLKILA